MQGSRAADLFHNNLDQLQSVQEASLRDILQGSAASEYGRRHDFAMVRSWDEYRASCPLVDYEDLRDSIDRMAAGQPDILTTGQPAAFFRTSGSTSAPKLIPVTPSLMRQKLQAFGVFWHWIRRDHPAVREGPVIANFGDSGSRQSTAAGIPVLSETTFWNRRMRPFQSRAGWTLPPEVREVTDSDNRFYAVARLALEAKLSGLMCLNPSTAVRLGRMVSEYRETLARDLRSGSITWPNDTSAPSSVPAVADRLDAACRVRHDAADRLAGLAPEDLPDLTGLWPDLRVLICWRSEPVRPYLRDLERLFPSTAHRDYITQSSECIMAIPDQDDRSGGPLAYTSHVFEFIPADHVHQGQPETIAPWNVEPGTSYEIVATTGGGLHRYRTGDIVRVTGYVKSVPTVEFLHRRGATSSMTGEKLTELHVLDAASRTQPAPDTIVCYPRTDPRPHYGVIVHWSAGPPPPPALQAWVAQFETQLQSANSEYQDKRQSGRLGAPVGFAVTRSDLDACRDHLTPADVSAEQFKLTALVRQPDLDRHLLLHPARDAIRPH